MKNSMQLFATSLLVAFMLTAALQPRARCAATARPTCGPSVFGHVIGSDHSRELCLDDGKVIFISGDHVYSQGLDTCPQDGTPFPDFN